MSIDILSLSDDYVFHTVEGEGKYVGMPSVFMRMANCNLTCQGFASEDSPHGCDSFISWSKDNRLNFDKVNSIFEDNGYVEFLKRGDILKITGGEPMLQQKKILRWLDQFTQKYQIEDINIDIESNSTILPNPEWKDKYNTKFTLSPKMSNNGDPEKKRFKPKVLNYHIQNKECFKFVINHKDDLNELFDKYINGDEVQIPQELIWLMPCCGSRAEHTEKAPMVAEFCKKYGFNFSPRLQLIIWDMALKV